MTKAFSMADYTSTVAVLDAAVIEDSVLAALTGPHPEGVRDPAMDPAASAYMQACKAGMRNSPNIWERDYHYSKVFCYDKLREASIKLSRAIVREFPHAGMAGHKWPLLCCMGSSGLAITTATALRLDAEDYKFGVMYVRKEGEKSHGNRVEWGNVVGMDMKDAQAVFVDDFISSGTTLRDTMVQVTAHVPPGTVADEVYCFLAYCDQRFRKWRSII